MRQMRVRLTTSRSEQRVTHNEGDEITVSVDEGHRMIASGQAVLVRDSAVERAVRPAPERAVKKRTSRRAAKPVAA